MPATSRVTLTYGPWRRSGWAQGKPGLFLHPAHRDRFPGHRSRSGQARSERCDSGRNFAVVGHWSLLRAATAGGQAPRHARRQPSLTTVTCARPSRRVCQDAGHALSCDSMPRVSRDLRDVDSHFRFGANWKSYAGTVNAERVEGAELGLERLLGPATLQGGRTSSTSDAVEESIRGGPSPGRVTRAGDGFGRGERGGHGDLAGILVCQW